MIYDRTIKDISDGKRIFSEKVQKFLPLTENEQRIIDKAFFNLKAVNRITAQMLVLWEMVVRKGGTKFGCDELRVWNKDELFKKTNFENIINNLGKLLNQIIFLGVLKSYRINEYMNNYQRITTDYSYTNLNALEGLLYSLQFDMVEEPRWAVQNLDILNIARAYDVKASGEEMSVR